jgi:hypothetical protein
MNNVIKRFESAADAIAIATLLIGLPTAVGAFILSSI